MRYIGQRRSSPRIGLPRMGVLLLLLAFGSIVFPGIRSSLRVSPEVVDPIELLDASDTKSAIGAIPVTQIDQPKLQFPVATQDAPAIAGESKEDVVRLNSDASQDNSISEQKTGLGSWLSDKEQMESELPDLLSLVTDNTIKIAKNEMFAYWRLIKLSQQQSFDELHDRSRHDPRFNEFVLSSSRHRGELISLDLNVRRVVSYPVEYENIAGVRRVYEIWGTTDQSRTWLYDVLVTELPPGLHEGDNLNLRASFAGYYFKLQGYFPYSAKPNVRPTPAPLLIGKLSNVTQAVAPTKASELPGPSLTLLLALVAAMILAVVVYLAVTLRRKPPRKQNQGFKPEPSLDWMETISVPGRD